MNEKSLVEIHLYTTISRPIAVRYDERAHVIYFGTFFFFLYECTSVCAFCLVSLSPPFSLSFFDLITTHAQHTVKHVFCVRFSYAMNSKVRSKILLNISNI